MKIDVKQRLSELADPKYMKFTSGLLPGTKNITGIRLPLLRSLAKEIAKEEGAAYFKHAPNDTFEEIMLEGMVIGYCKVEYEEKIALIEAFLPKIDNWSVCDGFCSGLVFIKKHRNEFFKYVKQKSFTNEEFTLRFTIVVLLDFYIVDEYIDEVLTILNNVRHDGYYVKMAVAWAISVCMVKFPEKTFKFIKMTEIDQFTYNKAIQKCIESFRISNELKEILRQMKKRGMETV